MERHISDGPAYWVEELARSDAELARGERIPGHVVHAELDHVIEELDAELAQQADAALPDHRNR